MDIDRLIELGKSGKMDELEFEREKMFNEVISKVNCEKQKIKLSQLHFTIKNMKYKYKNPYVCALKVNQLMIEKLGELNSAWNNTKEFINDEKEKTKK